jgi:hypothetical protein
MNPNAAERAEKYQLIEGRIQVRYEQLSGGYLMEGEKLDRVRALPLDYLRKLAEKLDSAMPGSTIYNQRPAFIVESVISEYSVALLANEQANMDANGSTASVDMNPQ